MNKDLVQRMLGWMRQNTFLPKDGERHLLAVSGGLDSVCMAHLYKETGLGFGIIHCNFQLRGVESDGDADFVAQLAKKLDVSFHSERFNTKAAAEMPGVSTQMAARDLRYAYFSKIQQKFGYTHIATAHHADDAIETALFNFSRGTGLTGMRGIPVQNGLVVRPLLCFSRKDLEKMAESMKIDWREDSSNKKDDYARNFIRHQITPKFAELNPAFSETGSRTLGHLRVSEANHRALVQYFLEKELQKAENGNTFLPFDVLEKMPFPSEILWAWLAPFGFDEEQCRQLEESRKTGQSGLELLGKESFSIVRERKKFVLRSMKTEEIAIKINANDLMTRLPDGKNIFLLQNAEAQVFPDGKFTVLVDAKTLHFPLLLRTWRPGDAFQPFGMNGQSQKVKDFLINEKVSPSEKEEVWVLEDSQGVICWVVGYRMAEQWRVKKDTKSLVKMVVT